MTLRFLHAADLHLDSPVTGVGSTPPEVRTALRDASLAAWDRLVQAAIDGGVGAVVVAGGVAPEGAMSPRARVALASGLARLSAAGIVTVLLDDDPSGVEDRRTTREAELVSIPGVHLVGGSAGEVLTIEPRGHDPFTVHAVASDGGDLTDRIRAIHRTGVAGLHIGLVDMPVATGPERQATGEVLSADDLRPAGLDYWAVGGDHHGRVVAEAPWVVITGTTQGRGFEASESGPKGAVLVTAEGSEVRAVRAVPLDVVRFASVVVDITSLDRAGDIGQALVAAAEGIAVEASQLAVVRGILTGSGPVRDEVRRPGAMAEILSTLTEIGVGQDHLVWWDRLVDRTAPEFDFEAIRGRGDLSAEVLRLGQELREDPDTMAAWVRSLGDAAGPGHGDPVPAAGPGDAHATWAGLLAEAEVTAIGELDRDDEA